MNNYDIYVYIYINMYNIEHHIQVVTQLHICTRTQIGIVDHDL